MEESCPHILNEGYEILPHSNRLDIRERKTKIIPSIVGFKNVRQKKHKKRWITLRQLSQTAYLLRYGEVLEIEALVGSHLFNKIMRSKKMLSERRRITLIMIYKNKGDIQDFTNYRGLNL